MKKTGIMAALMFTLVLAVALPATAQTQAAGQGSIQALSLEEGLLGRSVMAQGEEAADVEDVIFDRQGRISYFLLNVGGGFLGFGGRTVAVRPERFRVGAQDYLTFDGTKNELENMPEVDLAPFRTPYRGYYGPGWGPYRAPYGYYGAPPAGPYGPGAYPPAQGRWQEGGARQQDQQQQRRGDTQERTEMRQGQRGDGQMMRTMRQGISGDFLLGSPIFNEFNETLGNIEDLVIDPSTSRITHAVIGVGGFLGIGGREVVVPYNQLNRAGPYTYIYRGSKEQLEGMPEYRVTEGGRVPVAGLQQTPRAGGQGYGQQPQQQQQRQGGWQQPQQQQGPRGQQQ